VKEKMILAGIKRVGTSPLERLAWAVDFSQRVLQTPGDRLNAELELTCFVFGPNLRSHPGLTIPAQIKALMTNPHWQWESYQGKEVTQVQRRFTEVLRAAAGHGEVDEALKYLKVRFTRAEGLEYENRIPIGLRQPANEQEEAKLELAFFKLLRLLDKSVRTSLAKAKGGERFTPVRLYVGICPEARDGCGKIFAKTRIDQNYCSRTCVSGAQVYRFRRNQRALKQLYPGKRMKDLTTSESARVQQLAESLG
jgi:hypothetical protein